MHTSLLTSSGCHILDNITIYFRYGYIPSAPARNRRIQNRSRLREKRIVEFDYISETAVVSLQFVNPDIRKFFLQTGIKQSPIRSSPTVYALLYITDYQIIKSLGITVLYKRPEILPLYLRCILKLVKKEMFKPYTELFVYERRI